MSTASLSVLEDEAGDADALGRGGVPLDGPPAHGLVLGKLEADSIDKIRFEVWLEKSLSLTVQLIK